MIIKGQKISDRYQIIRTIGEGGMANVYLAYDTILNRDVAVKVLRGDLANDEKFVKKFQREAISASSLSHPNIVEMYDVGEDNGNYFIVMEFVDGKTLKNLIKKRGVLTLPEVIDIMLQLTSGIMCAHDSYIIHRDIKPQNVMILDDGRVKITDFGIAIAANASELTQTNSVMGSVHYLPPEQANGNGATIKSDIYSLGILMFELLTGRLPFKGETAVEVALKQLKQQIPSVCKINPEIPQSIENIILKACAKNPKNRYDSVNEMYEDIKTCLDEERRNERRHNYEFSEQELEETKNMPNLQNVKDLIQESDNKKPDKEKKSNLLLWILGSVFVTLIIAIGCLLIFMPKSSTVKVPNVIGLNEKDATSQLVKKKFSVMVELEFNDDVKEGLVIRTKPSYGTAKKEGSEIVIVVSKGPENIPLTIEEYKNEDATKVKNRLEAYGLIVIIETKTVDDKTKYKENIVIDQSVKKGEILKAGDEITLFIADLTPEYPNFSGYTLNQVEEFCLKHEITLKKEYRETMDALEGTILSQDKPEGYLVRRGEQTLTIVIAKKPVVVEPEIPTEPTNPEEEDTP